MLRFSLILAALFAWPMAALAQERGAEALQIFEFDYDQKGAPIVNLPAKAETPAGAQKKPVPAKTVDPPPVKAQSPAKTVPPTPAKTPSPAKTVLPTPAKVLAPNPPVATAPAKPPAPIKAEAPAPAKPTTPSTKAPDVKPPTKTTAPLQSRIQNGVLAITGEAGSPGLPNYDNPPDFRAEEINLSPAGLPSTTRIPAKPGEARVEKSGPGPGAAGSAARPAPAAYGPRLPARAGGARPDSSPGSVQRFWQAAQNNWARYGGTPHSRPPSLSPVRTVASEVIGYTSTGLPFQDLTMFSGF